MKTLWYLALAAVLPCYAEPSVTLEKPQAERQLIDQAHRYIKSLGVDYGIQRSFYTEQTVFEDVTSESFGPRWRFVGPDRIIGFWKRSFEGYGALEVRPQIHDTMVQAPFVMVTYTAHVTSCAVTVGLPDKLFTGRIKLITALRIVDGKVLTHTDYGAYDEANRQLAKRVEELKQQPDDPRCKALTGNRFDGEPPGADTRSNLQ